MRINLRRICVRYFKKIIAKGLYFIKNNAFGEGYVEIIASNINKKVLNKAEMDYIIKDLFPSEEF